MAFSARFVRDVVHTAAVAFRTDLIASIAGPAGNAVPTLIHTSTAVTFFATWGEHNRGNVTVVRV